jgi:LacI family transcriptional regulator
MRPPQHPNRAGKATLADIARRARVSTITASRALHGGLPVAEATRARVLAAADDLGYTPNLLARGLVQNRTSTIGVIIIELANPFFAPMVSAVETVAAKRGFLVMVGESARNQEWERQYVVRFQQLRVGGIIVAPALITADYLAAAREAGTPVVVMSRRWDGGDFVTADNAAGGRLAARHLLSRGHRRIGLVAHEGPADTSFQDRLLAFRQVLAAAGVSVPAAWDLRMKATRIEDGIEAADGLLSLRRRPSAVFAMTDRMAMGLTHRLLARGIRVPEDMAIVGYDDIPFAACNQVPLTTVRIPVQQVGGMAAEMLFERMNGSISRKHQQRLLEPEMVVRDSCP